MMPVPLTVSSSFDPGTLGTYGLTFVGPYLIALLGLVSTLALAIGMMAMFRHYAKKIPQSGMLSRGSLPTRQGHGRPSNGQRDRAFGHNVGRSHKSHRKASRKANFSR